MSEYRAITITKGSGGFGGPLTVEPKEGKDVLLYITGGGAEPEQSGQSSEPDEG